MGDQATMQGVSVDTDFWTLCDSICQRFQGGIQTVPPRLSREVPLETFMATISDLIQSLSIPIIWQSRACRASAAWGLVCGSGIHQWIEVAPPRPPHPVGHEIFLPPMRRLPGTALHELVHILYDTPPVDTREVELQAELVTYLFSLAHGMNYWVETHDLMIFTFDSARQFYAMAQTKEVAILHIVKVLLEKEKIGRWLSSSA